MKRPAARAPRTWPLDPVLDFMRLLWEIEHELQSTSKQMEGRLGVTGPQRLVLLIVHRFPGISAGELAELVHLHPSTLTGVLRRLSQKGLLARTTDPDDKCRAVLRVQRTSAVLTSAETGTVEAGVRRALRHVPPRKIAHTRDVLRMLALELGRTRETPIARRARRPPAPRIPDNSRPRSS